MIRRTDREEFLNASESGVVVELRLRIAFRIAYKRLPEGNVECSRDVMAHLDAWMKASFPKCLCG
jgi:hypothetical protein